MYEEPQQSDTQQYKFKPDAETHDVEIRSITISKLTENQFRDQYQNHVEKIENLAKTVQKVSQQEEQAIKESENTMKLLHLLDEDTDATKNIDVNDVEVKRDSMTKTDLQKYFSLSNLKQKQEQATQQIENSMETVEQFHAFYKDNDMSIKIEQTPERLKNKLQKKYSVEL